MYSLLGGVKGHCKGRELYLCYGKEYQFAENFGSSKFLSFSFHWFRSSDIAVGLLVCCLKDNRMNCITVKV